MISKKELDYVSELPSRVPYPGLSYSEETLEKLKESLKLYKTFYEGRICTINFSDGTEIDFEIMEKNIAHLLGVTRAQLTNDYVKDFREKALDLNPDAFVSAYNLLESIILYSDRVLDYIHKKGGNYLNFYKIRVKCDIFKRFSDFSKFDFGCINFNKEKYTLKTNLNFMSESERIFFVPSNEAVAPFFMMGILKDGTSQSNPEGVYVPETIIAPYNATDFFDEQVVTVPTQIVVSTSKELTKIEATASEKMYMISLYKSIILKHDLPDNLNIMGDYEALLAKMSNEESKRLSLNNL